MTFRRTLVAVLLAVGHTAALRAQATVVRSSGVDADPTTHLAQDLGSTGLYQALLRLRTTASLMHTTAHPDDEHAGMLTRLARGHVVRTSLLTLNRGEGGANAIGPELFDGLGIIRTEELLRAGRYRARAPITPGWVGTHEAQDRPRRGR